MLLSSIDERSYILFNVNVLLSSCLVGFLSRNCLMLPSHNRDNNTLSLNMGITGYYGVQIFLSFSIFSWEFSNLFLPHQTAFSMYGLVLLFSNSFDMFSYLCHMSQWWSIYLFCLHISLNQLFLGFSVFWDVHLYSYRHFFCLLFLKCFDDFFVPKFCQGHERKNSRRKCLLRLCDHRTRQHCCEAWCCGYGIYKVSFVSVTTGFT